MLCLVRYILSSMWMLPWLCHPGASWQEMLLNKIIFSCISENRALRQADNGAVVLSPVTTFTALYFWQSFISFFNVSITLWTILWGYNLCPVNFYIPVSRVMYSMIKHWKKKLMALYLWWAQRITSESAGSQVRLESESLTTPSWVTSGISSNCYGAVVKTHMPMQETQETQVRSLHLEDPLE